MSPPWPRHAQQWDLIGPPLRPVAEDLAQVAQVAHGGRTLILGVTPELARMTWPAGTSLLALDHSLPMIRAVWPRPLRSVAVQGNWCRMPLRSGSIALAAGDGCYSMFAFPDGYRAFSGELRRVLAPEGRLVIRVFASPAIPEDVAAVERDLWSGQIGNFHVFKWRLAMALQRTAAEGVCLDDLHRAFSALCPSPAALTEKLGWSAASVGTIEAYRGSATRYTFPSLNELRAALAADFRERSCHVPAYELGERCPTLVLEAR